MHSVGDAHDQPHVVLYQEDRQLEVVAQSLEERPELLDLLVTEPSCRLVEQQQLRARGERTCELHALLRRVRELQWRAIADGVEAHVEEDVFGARLACPSMCADPDVVEHRHPAEELDVLERACDPALDDPARRRVEEGLAVEANVTLVGCVEARDHVERRRLAGPVRPDQPDDLAGLRGEGDGIERDDAAETFRDVVDLEEGQERHTLRRSAAEVQCESTTGSALRRTPGTVSDTSLVSRGSRARLRVRDR